MPRFIATRDFFVTDWSDPTKVRVKIKKDQKFLFDDTWLEVSPEDRHRLPHMASAITAGWAIEVAEIQFKSIFDHIKELG